MRLGSLSYWILTLCLILSMSSSMVGAVEEGQDEDALSDFIMNSDSDTREEILQNRERRKRQLRNMINRMRKQLADHSSGEIILDKKEKIDIERRLDVYARKLDTMNQDLDESVRFGIVQERVRERGEGTQTQSMIRS